MTIRRFGSYPSDDVGSDLRVSGLSREQAKLALSYAAETRRFEIERFWQRSLFFWGMVAAAFVAFAALQEKDLTSQFLIGCFGIVTSTAWTLQNRGAKYWHESWEHKTHLLQRRVLGTDLFSNKEPVQFKGWFGASRFSVSKITVILSDASAVIWLALTFRLVRPAWPCAADFELSLASLVTGVLVALLLFGARSSAD